MKDLFINIFIWAGFAFGIGGAMVTVYQFLTV